MKILIVEDEEALRKGLKFNFEQEGYDVESAGDGSLALELFDAADPPVDLIILDLMLPGMSGYETCREIRQRDARVAVLVLSARTLSEDRATAFDCGADQYLSKPFALPELLSRVRNLTDRRQAMLTQGKQSVRTVTSDYSFDAGRVTVHPTRFEVTINGHAHSLTTMEFQLLMYFIEHEGNVLSRGRVNQDVWDDLATISSRSIDNFVMRLRRLIELDPANPRHLLSVRGTGYRFVAEPEPEL